jgi:MbtH protein
LETPIDELYQVVMNEEGQYSIWLARRELPDGWSGAGPVADKVACLAYIDEVWTDLRPLSLRRAMEAQRDGREARDLAE